jgi:hypothetical protein
MIFTKDAVSITVNGIILPLELDIKRYQSVGVATDATAKIRDESMDEIFYRVIIRENGRKMSNIRSFFINTTVLAKYPFSLTPDSGVDLGSQDGTAVTVNYWASDFMETMFAWQHYEYNLVLRRVYSS